MIAISKDEKMAISEKFPGVHIVRTMKQDSKRGHYYCVEERRVMKFLEALRNPSGAVKVGKN